MNNDMILSMNKKPLPINGGYPLHTFEEVEDLYKTYIFNQKDLEDIRKAYDFMVTKHNGQFRKSGEPYYHHPVEVAYILASLQVGPSTIIAGLLHDVVEDTDTTIEDIEKMWDSDIAKIVDSLTKIQRLKLSKIESEEFEAEDHRKILIGMAKDIRVILIKLADRLHNLRTLGALSHERQIALSQETLDVFVPIAHRLGLDLIRSEMADICLSYLHPEEFQMINKLLKKKAKTLDKSLDAIKKRIADILFEHEIPFEISARVKSIFSIYEKMYVKGHNFDEIYDILALRIITDTESHCYQALGLIHKTYTPVVGRFKDYIAMPKPNLYQSLHTTIISGDGNFYEVQIRTQEMDKIAETGVASHWAYKEGTNYNPKEEQKDIEDKLHWFRDFVSMSNDNTDESANEYMSNLTKDIFEANVYVFTPKGKVIELPANSTPIDFAYRIHSKIAESMTGALVNHVNVPFNTILKTGDMVEIKTSKNASGPTEGWLDVVVTSTARQYIRKFLAKKNAEVEREDRIEKGRTSCIDAFRERSVDENEMMELLSDWKTLQHFNVPTVEDLFIAVSGRKPTTNAIIDYLKIKKPIVVPQNSTKKVVTQSGKYPIYCKGVSRLAISRSNCCNPIPGDDIIGFITKGKGISVHRTNCPNVANRTERLVDVYWRSDLEYSTYPVDLLVEASNRQNLVIQIMTAMNNNHVNVSNLSARLADNGTKAMINMTIMVSDAKRLNDIKNILLNVGSVYNVSRLIH
ncbi:MAG: bifunctional (p)ppGpp synthetase/guanosine-3',5'-bis(diphosphate) 3'-pyrophosphohydrolase [Erysipelotrichaceae bacterium]|nr:bifunctional (p)ppGpp synthetase/guanosine-3',5'-bis(diphosphate) 3'-pyrophosphohydrolase [Erysipelotrichaceae bacterium]